MSRIRTRAHQHDSAQVVNICSSSSCETRTLPCALSLFTTAEEERLRAEFRVSQRSAAAVAGLLHLPPPSEKFAHLAHHLTVCLTSAADASGASRASSNVKAMKNPGTTAGAGGVTRPASASATTSSKTAKQSKEKQPWTTSGTCTHAHAKRECLPVLLIQSLSTHHVWRVQVR